MPVALTLLVMALLTVLGCTPPAPADAGADAAPDAADDAPLDAPPDEAPDAPVATPLQLTTPQGPVTGLQHQGYAEFLGIPYAAPPVGPLRFRPPAPAAPWTTTRDATMHRAKCPQDLDPLGGMVPQSEDCLFLSVYTPRADAAAPPRPVMVWLHGGGFNTGSGVSPVFHGGPIARQGVVLVTLNYRIGAMGFLAHPALAAEDTAHGSTGNYGFLDQVAALAWVRDNIRAYGGDPTQVTLFGESAGAMATCGHLVSPLSRGLFHRAILQSGTCSYLGQPVRDTPPITPGYESGEAFGRRIATAVGCADGAVPDVPACLRARTPAQFIAATPALSAFQTRVARFWANVDGYVFPEPPWLAVTATPPRVADVPVLLGTNREEGDLFALMAPDRDGPEYQAAVRGLFGDRAAEALAAYPVATFGNARAVLAAMNTDLVFTCPTRAMARALAAAGRRVYLYEFTRVNPSARLLGLRAAHGFEIPYVFGNLVSPFATSDTDQALARVMSPYWTRFAASGDPGGAGAPVAWPAYDGATDVRLEFGTTAQTATGQQMHRCDAIAGWLYPI